MSCSAPRFRKPSFYPLNYRALQNDCGVLLPHWGEAHRKDSKKFRLSETEVQTEREGVGAGRVVAREVGRCLGGADACQLEHRVGVGVGARALGVGRVDVAVGQVDVKPAGRTQRQTDRVGQLGHRGGLGIEVVAAHGALVDVHTHARRQKIADAVLAADADRQRVGVVLVAGQRHDGRVVGRIDELDVEPVIGAPEDILQVDGKLPLRRRAEADAPRERGGERKFGLYHGRGEVLQRGELGSLEQLTENLTDGGVVNRLEGDGARVDLHAQLRAVGEAERPLLVDVPHDAGVDADGHLGVSLEGERHEASVAGHLEDVGQRRHGRLQRPHEQLVLGVVGPDGEQRAREVERTPGHHQTGAHRDVLADAEADGRLEVVGREVDGLHQMGTRPVVAPVHRGAKGGVEGQTHRHPVERLVVDVGVEGRRDFVVRGEVALGRGARVVGQRGVGGLRGDARDADRDVEFRLLEGSGGRVEPHGLGVELHGRTDVSHTVLLRGEVVYLVSFGRGRERCRRGGQKEEDFFHVKWFRLILGGPLRGAQQRRQR